MAFILYYIMGQTIATYFFLKAGEDKFEQNMIYFVIGFIFLPGAMIGSLVFTLEEGDEDNG